MTDTTAIETVPTDRALGLFSATQSPTDVIAGATEIAHALGKVIKDRKLFKHIGQRDYVFLEGWTLLGSMVGAFAAIDWSRPVYIEGSRPYGWEARAEVRNAAGVLLGAAEAQCTRDESKWRDNDDYQLRSMAQTRATVKALRLPLGFIVQLAGYDATPADEMPDEYIAPPAPDNVGAVLHRLRTAADTHSITPAELDDLAQRLYGNRTALLQLGDLIALGRRIAAGEFDDEGNIT